MKTCEVTFETSDEVSPVSVAAGALLSDAAILAGVEINEPCGGQGRCGRCTVQVVSGSVRRRSTVRLTQDDIAEGHTLSCQTVITEDIRVVVQPWGKIERRLTTDRVVGDVQVPAGYSAKEVQSMRRIPLNLAPPSMDDQTDDWSRLQTALRSEAKIELSGLSLGLLRQMGPTLRESGWAVTAVVDTWEEAGSALLKGRLQALYPGHVPEEAPLWGIAVDIGTTTVTVWLVDLLSGKVVTQASEYNGQIARGEDVISRIVYATKEGGSKTMVDLVLGTINGLIAAVCAEMKISPGDIQKASVAGNPTMMHLFLGIPAQSIRLSPYVPVVNQLPMVTGAAAGLMINPEAVVDCLPGVASYVGSDITAGVLSSGLSEMVENTLFIDVGTNGEIVLGNRDWLITCACSAGPAFEGAGVTHGMRATKGAIEDVWIAGGHSAKAYEPTSRVIGNVRPIGICGSGLISLLAEMFLTGIVDKGGGINLSLPTPRVRTGEHGPEYVVAWGSETEDRRDIVITAVDIDNLKRAKAAIFAGFNVLAASVGVEFESIDQLLIGGSFGKYINVEKAVQIGLLPDLPTDKFQFLGNTSAKGAYYALLDRNIRAQLTQIASRMTYLELSADNSFYEAFMSASFLPHTDLDRFPSVEAAVEKHQ